MGAGRLANIANHLWSTTRVVFAQEIQVNMKFAPAFEASAVQMAQAEVANSQPQTRGEPAHPEQADEPVAIAHDEGPA